MRPLGAESPLTLRKFVPRNAERLLAARVGYVVLCLVGCDKCLPIKGHRTSCNNWSEGLAFVGQLKATDEVAVDGPQHTRKFIRFPLDARTVFWWVDSGVTKRSEGRTRDISEKGAFVLASICPPQGIQIGFNVFLPPLSGFEERTRVEANGHVLRVEQVQEHEECEGFAILIEHILLLVNNDVSGRGESGGNELN